MITYQDLIDKAMSYFSTGEFQTEVAVAKEEFNKAVGIFDEESADLEMKINLFMDWFIFSRQLSSQKIRPIELLANGNTLKLPQEEQSLCVALQNSRISIFEFQKLKGQDVYVKDLFSGYKLVLKRSEVDLGFNKDELFSTRLFPYEDSFIFSRSFCIHPSMAMKFIKSEIKKVTKLESGAQEQARELLIFKLLKMRYKIDQYKHVKLKDIYSNESKLRI